jgi:hypothetical protein
MCSVLALDSPGVNQLQVDFVSQCGGLQGFAGAPSEIQPCDPPEFRIDKGGIKRSSASLLPLVPWRVHPGNVVRPQVRHRGRILTRKKIVSLLRLLCPFCGITD